MSRAALEAPPSANVAGLLAQRAAAQPDRVALVAGDRRLTLSDLAGAARGVAGLLAARGIGQGDRVLLFLPMSPGLYAAVLGCWHLGAVVVLVDAWADRARLDAAVRTAAPRAMLGSRKAMLLVLVSAAIRRIPVRLALDLQRLLPAPAHDRPAADLAADDPALVTLTTGSTGAPRAAARSHAFLLEQHAALQPLLALRDTDVDYPTLPVFVLNSLAAGAACVLPDFDPRRPTADPERVYQQLIAEGVTVASGSPAVFAALADWCFAAGRRLPLRALFTGGAPVFPAVAETLCRATDGEVWVVYGSTEAEPVAAIAAPEMLARQTEYGGDPALAGLCAGPPVPGLELRVVRACDGPIELGAGGWPEWGVTPGEPGEIVVTGPHVLGRYLDNPDEDRRHKIVSEGRVWHRTGDGGWVDDCGNLWLLGRVAERLERGGTTYWPLPVERRALAVPGVTHAAYLAVCRGGRRAGALCVEFPRGKLPTGVREQLLAIAGPAPLDELHAFRRIPRDPRHASKTDSAKLRRMLRAAS